MEFTPEGEIVENNELFREVFDYTSKQIKNTTIWQYFPKEDHEKLQTIWDDVSSGKPFQGQLRMINRQKEEKWFRITLSAVNDMYGEVAKIILLAQDVTKEKQMEIETEKQTEQLRIQEEKLRKAGEELAKKLDEAKLEMKNQFKEIETVKIRNERTLEGALDAIVTINQGGVIEFFNKAAEDLWKMKRDEVIGQHVRKLFSPETIMNDDFVARYTKPDEEKIVGVRTEVKIQNSDRRRSFRSVSPV